MHSVMKREEELPFCPDWLVGLWFVAVEATELLLSPESPSR
jgi:hypothetical protein